jgi:heterodisulfide reductase subunit C
MEKEMTSIESAFKNDLQILMDKNAIHMCLECGKCSAVCPMVNFYGEYVYKRCTRAVVERLCFEPGGLDDEALWYCWACKECSFFCPSGVDFQNFMIGLRELLVSRGNREYAHFCSTCGAFLMPKRQLHVLKSTLNGNGTADLLDECPNCKRGRCAEVMFRVSPKGKTFFGVH